MTRPTTHPRSIAVALAAAILLAASPTAAQSTRTVRSWEDFQAGLASYSSVMESMDTPDASDPFVTSAFIAWGFRGIDATAMTMWLLAEDPEPCYAGLWGATIALSSSLAHIAYLQGMAKIAIWPAELPYVVLDGMSSALDSIVSHANQVGAAFEAAEASC